MSVLTRVIGLPKILSEFIATDGSRYVPRPLKIRITGNKCGFVINYKTFTGIFRFSPGAR